MEEMIDRGYKVNINWYDRLWRGNTLQKISSLNEVGTFVSKGNCTVYPEHDDKYLEECLENLRAKNVKLVNGESVSSMLMKLVVKEGM